jgi:hypothetical protein
VVVGPHPPRPPSKASRKKGQKHLLCHIAIMASNDNGDEEDDSSDEGFIATIEREFKRQTRLLNDHFGKLFEATCPHHPYPANHKLKDCTMMKKFMMSGTPSRGSKL